MLKNIRDNIQGTAAKIIIGIMVIPFVFYGIDSFFSGGGDSTAAKINSHKVSEGELRQAIDLQRRQLFAMMGDNIDPSMLEESALRSPALQSLITQQVLLQHADNQRMSMPDSLVNRSIVEMEEFHENGRFSQQRYQQLLRSQGYSGSFFRSLMRTDMLLEHLNAAISGSAFLTNQQRENAIRLLEQKRSYYYVRLPLSRYAEEVEVSEDSIEAYYRDNEQQFKTSEAVRVSYIELREEDFYPQIENVELRAEYERQISALQSQADRRAAHILVEFEEDREAALARIQEAREALEAGQDFAEVAQQFSDDAGSARQGGDLGFSSGDIFPPAFERALTALEVGQVSSPVETDAGLHLIKLLERRDVEVPGFEDLKSDIERRLQSQRAQPKLVAKVERLRDLAFNAADLQRPARELGLEVQQSDWLTRETDNPLLSFSQVRQAIFDQRLRDQAYNSDVYEVDTGHYVVIHHEDYRPPELRPLAEVRDEIVAELTAEMASELANSRAADMLKAIADGADLETLAREQGLDWQVAIRSNRQDSAIKPVIRRAAFELPRPPENTLVSKVVIDDNGDRVLVQLTAVEDGSLAETDPQRRRELQTSVLRAQGSLDFSIYFNGLYDSAKIEVN